MKQRKPHDERAESEREREREIRQSEQGAWQLISSQRSGEREHEGEKK